MTKQELTALIHTATHKEKADIVFKNANVVDVFQHTIVKADVAIKGKYIVGLGSFEGEKEVDCKGKYIVPGYIDSHIHVESSYLSPEELGKILVPHGTSTIIADPHEIVNVCGITGFKYMLNAAKHTALDIKYMLPSCVPATPFETSGAVINAADMEEPINYENVLGLGEFMNYPGIINADSDTLDKIMVAFKNNKLIDGHSPGVKGDDLTAYLCARIHTDHECSSLEEMNARLSAGVYVLLRQGTACHDLVNLLKGVTVYNSRRCLLCSDDRHPKTVFECGHIDNHLRLCVQNGIDPITAIQMATINAAECFRLSDRGAIAPGLLADIAVLDNLEEFNCEEMYMEGVLVAKDGKYLPHTEKYPIDSVMGTVVVKDFSKKKLALKLSSDDAIVIELLPGGVLTKKTVEHVKRNEKGEFVYDPNKDVVKVAVVERHKGTGNVAVGLLKGFGLKHGAIAQSIAHDSHNIIVVGISDDEMEKAVEALIKQQGGVVLVKDGKVLESIPMPIGGIMSDKDGREIAKELEVFNKRAFDELKISKSVEPIMTLGFMSLAVIPEIKLTDKGLFDVTKFTYITQ